MPNKITIKQKQRMQFLCASLYSMCFKNNNLYILHYYSVS